MQLLEILLLISALIFLFGSFKNSQFAKWSGILTMTILVLQLLFEGYRWQLIPVYIALIFPLLNLLKPLNIKWLKATLIILSSLLVFLSGTLGHLLPVIKFPQPKGPYSIGQTALFIEDKNRDEIITPETTDFRKFTVQVWYPSEAKVKKPEIYLDEAYGSTFALSKGFPPFIVSHFNLTKTHIEKGLPIFSQKPLPVIILSHGLMWNNELYTSIIEEIVSQGYCVFGVEHTYEAPLTTFKGEKITWRQEYFNEVHSNGDFDGFMKLLDEFKLEKDTLKKGALMKRMIASFPGWTESMNTWAKDLRFFINELENVNDKPESFFFQKLNLDQIGLLGHSWGGAVVAHTAALDTRVKAVINMDGAQWGELIDTTLNTPFMAMYADRNYDEFFTPNFHIYEQVAKADFYEAFIQQSDHANFGDLGYWSKVPQLTGTGKIAPQRMTQITNELILSFFDQYVLNKKSDILARFQENTFPEVQLNKY